MRIPFPAPARLSTYPILAVLALTATSCDPNAQPYTYGPAHPSARARCTNEPGAPYRFHVQQNQLRNGRPTIALNWRYSHDHPNGVISGTLQRDGGRFGRVLYENIGAVDFADGDTRWKGVQTVVEPGVNYTYQVAVTRNYTGIHWSCVRLSVTWNGFSAPDYGDGW